MHWVPPPPPPEREDLKMALQRRQLTTNQEADSCWRLLCWNHMVAITEHNINQGTGAECDAYCLRLSLGPSGWYFRSTAEAITGVQLKITHMHTSLWEWLRLGRILSGKTSFPWKCAYLPYWPSEMRRFHSRVCAVIKERGTFGQSQASWFYLLPVF